MPTINFTTNLLPFQNRNSWAFHPNFFEGKDKNGNQITNPVPNGPGVYIVGVKIPVQGQGEKFCPLYVGIQKNLRTKIEGHRNPANRDTRTGELNSFKEIFDLCNFDIRTIYNEMCTYDQLNKGKRSHLKLFQNLNTLIWFNNSTFFNYKLLVNNSVYISGSGHKTSINTGGDLDLIGSKKSLVLKNKIINVKSLYSQYYYYCYCELDQIVKSVLEENENPLTSLCQEHEITKYWEVGKDNRPGKTICEKIEGLVKNKLQTIGIYTTAKALKTPPNFNIDLSKIQTELVNMTGLNNIDFHKKISLL